MRDIQAIVLGLPLLLAAVPPLAAQAERESDPLRTDAPREELAILLNRLEQAANSPAYSDHLRSETHLRATQLRERLEEGDFRVGDRILLLVENQPTLSDTFAVNLARELELPEIGAVPLRSIMRGELQEYLRQHLGRFLREPRVRVHPLIRIGISGGVGRPGFHNVPSDIPVTEVIMLAGGPAGNAQLEKMRIDRGDQTIWEPDQMQQAMIDGWTLGQLNVQGGDHIVVPTGGGSSEQTLRLTLLLLSVPVTIAALASIFR
jgi:protein involved in polysaccharide export with SLBB domain